MKFVEVKLPGVFVVELERETDARGFFARSWCQKEFQARGFNSNLVQCNISFNRKKGTLRGLHYQAGSDAEVKLVRCTRGKVYDVVVDIRPDSATFKKWCAVELAADKHTMLYIPAGFAHGFQTLEDETEVFYQMSNFYKPDSARGLRWNDPAFGIRWPIPNPVLSAKDQSYKDFNSKVIA